MPRTHTRQDYDLFCLKSTVKFFHPRGIGARFYAMKDGVRGCEKKETGREPQKRFHAATLMHFFNRSVHLETTLSHMAVLAVRYGLEYTIALFIDFACLATLLVAPHTSYPSPKDG